MSTPVLLCKGAWLLNTACGTCPRCVETAPQAIAWLQADVARLLAERNVLGRLEAWRTARTGRLFVLTAFECCLLDNCTRKRVRALPHDLAQANGDRPDADTVIVAVGTSQEPATCAGMILAALGKWQGLYGADA